MVERKGIADTPREHFRRAAEDELEKFVRKEIAFQQGSALNVPGSWAFLSRRRSCLLVSAEFETSDPAISLASTAETIADMGSPPSSRTIRRAFSTINASESASFPRSR